MLFGYTKRASTVAQSVYRCVTLPNRGRSCFSSKPISRLWVTHNWGWYMLFFMTADGFGSPQNRQIWHHLSLPNIIRHFWWLVTDHRFLTLDCWVLWLLMDQGLSVGCALCRRPLTIAQEQSLWVPGFNFCRFWMVSGPPFWELFGYPGQTDMNLSCWFPSVFSWRVFGSAFGCPPSIWRKRCCKKQFRRSWNSHDCRVHF